MKTKKYAVIGHPIGHTMSPFIHSRLFALGGISGEYGALDVAPSELHGKIEKLKELSGFNITIPHKRSIIPLLDKLDPKAEMFGSVNTVKNENGILTGYTTDGEGFRRTAESAGANLSGRTVILGAGGAARAIAFETALSGGTVVIATRVHSMDAGTRLCEDLRQKVPGARASNCLIGEISGTADLLVNATPAGMYPNTETCPVDAEFLQNAQYVFDAVYNPAQTLLLRTARERGAKTIGGIGMLVRQAAAAQEIWLGNNFNEKDINRLCADANFEMKKAFGNIVLCGFMGSGKTTVGHVLAEQMGRRFVDMDEFIEQKEQMPVSEIFSSRGENYFRRLEKEAANVLSLKSGLVVATGGGALLSPQNTAVFKSNGVIVLLDASLNVIKERLKGDSSRPLLQNSGKKNAIENLYARRYELYKSAADITVDADAAPEQTAVSIRRELGTI